MPIKTPHILLAASNSRKMLENLRGILDPSACGQIEQAIASNAKALFDLVVGHFEFARGTSRAHWRQRVSRFYYGAYSLRRAVQLHVHGAFNRDVSDHKNIGSLPDGFPSKQMYERRLTDLREDRNLADYDHVAAEADLVLTQEEAQQLVADFIRDAAAFLRGRGVIL